MTNRFISSVTPPAHRTEPALWFAFAGNNLLYRQDSAEVVPQLVDFSELGLETVRYQYLGTFNGQPCYSVEMAESVVPPDGMVLKGLRQAYAHLDEDLFVIAGRAIQIVDWERTHQYCGQCGAKTVNHSIDRAKICPACGLTNFPRLSPAIIVRIRYGEKILLARAPHWPPGMHSNIAGFVEPGETLEQAVAREVMEEVGLTVKNIKYFGSQPWPFPNSLMLGFTADYADGEIKIDPVEIESAGWFTVDNLPVLPSKMSIARRLIDDFLNNVLRVA